MAVKERVIAEFLSTHNVNVPELFADDLDGVYWLINIRSALDENLSTRVEDLMEEHEPSWAITRSMLDRVNEQLTGGFIALFTQSWASVEVICRASLEAAINVLYVLESDTVNRVSQYVSSYFDDSSKSIDRYQALVMTIPGDNTVQLKSATDVGIASLGGDRRSKRFFDMKAFHLAPRAGRRKLSIVSERQDASLSIGRFTRLFHLRFTTTQMR